jgi:polar amino acid transport system substrate-binding protein
MRTFSFTLILSLLTLSAFAAAKPKLTICTDESFWYPFVFVKEGKASGIHIDIIETALRNLGYNFELFPEPWKRCLSEVQQGQKDALVSVSYTPTRARFVDYPPGTGSADKPSRFEVARVTYVVVNNKTTPYVFTGDVKTLPQPVQVPLGYSIAADLEAQGVNVIEFNYVRDMFRALALSHLRHTDGGSIITIPSVADKMQRDAEFGLNIKIQKRPISVKSYYFGFSKKSKLSAADRQAIWQEIAHVRDNKLLTDKFVQKYS